jgi:hypothetical protein
MVRASNIWLAFNDYHRFEGVGDGAAQQAERIVRTAHLHSRDTVSVLDSISQCKI